MEIKYLYPDIRAALARYTERLGEVSEHSDENGLITWWRGQYWARPEKVQTHEMMVVAGHGSEEIRRVRGFITAADVAKSMAAVLEGPD